MASASVSAAAGLDKAGCLGSVGRRWANSPITAHPKRRMRGIPLRVVQFSFQGSQAPLVFLRVCKITLRPRNPRGREEESENTPEMPGTHRPARPFYCPASAAIRLAGIKANLAERSWAAGPGQAANRKIKIAELTFRQDKQKRLE